MATHDDSHAAIADAELRSLDGRHRLVMRLLPIADRKHRDWISYELHMLQMETGETVSLVPGEDQDLFLDRVVEPEIPALCSGIREVMSGGHCYAFTPLDEKDFAFELRRHADSFVVRVQYRAAPAPTGFGWPNGLCVSATSLASFADSLERAFEALR